MNLRKAILTLATVLTLGHVVTASAVILDPDPDPIKCGPFLKRACQSV